MARSAENAAELFFTPEQSNMTNLDLRNELLKLSPKDQTPLAWFVFLEKLIREIERLDARIDSM